MKKTLIPVSLDTIPHIFHPLMKNASVYDSSCSPDAKVFFIDKDQGYYLKCSSKESLKTEAMLTAYFHKIGLGAEVLHYSSSDKDWLLTRAISGEDCTHPDYLQNPKKLSETTAELLYTLHNTDIKDCPIPNRISNYIHTAEENYRNNRFDLSLFPEYWTFSSKEEAWDIAQKNKYLLKNDTLIHGDYCLPNIILNNWKFSGFIDLGNGGVGDKHIDLFWGAWTLFYNLKTDSYQDRFLDAYGRSNFNPEMLRIIAAIEIFG